MADEVTKFDLANTVVVRIINGTDWIYYTPDGIKVIVVDLDKYPNAHINLNKNAGTGIVEWGKDPD